MKSIKKQSTEKLHIQKEIISLLSGQPANYNSNARPEMKETETTIPTSTPLCTHGGLFDY